MSNCSSCVLKNLLSNKTHILSHNEVFILGRNTETVIKDRFVSKSQIACCADIKRSIIKLKPIGEAISGLNGFAMKRGVVYIVGHKDIIELRLGLHKFAIIFNPSAEINEQQPIAKKPKISESLKPNEISSQGGTSFSNNEYVWENIENRELLIYTSKACRSSSKIAAFDIDGTIIKTKSGARFPKNVDDWSFYFDNNTSWKQNLKSLCNSNYKIVFFTNQLGVGKEASKIQEFKRKIENIVSSINLPIQVFIATGKSIYRKPRPGMWDILVKEKNENVQVNKDFCFFVGDAAGRKKNWAPKRLKDHSCADRLFAENIGIKFYTPEEYFLNSRCASFKMPDFDPRRLPDEDYPDLSYGKLNVVLMVGGPGSGKSFFCKKMLEPRGYFCVNRDTLGSWQKCVKAMENALLSGKDVVVDNTNGEKEARKRYIEAAKRFKADVRCFIMTPCVDHMRHNNVFRELTDKTHVHVSDIIIFSYNKNFQAPEMSEGYSQILKIPFVPEFTDSRHKLLYRMFLLEK